MTKVAFAWTVLLVGLVDADPPNFFQAPEFCPDEPPHINEVACGRRLDVNLDLTQPERADLAGYLKEYLTTEVIEEHMYEGQHGNSKFIPWHRTYIEGLEKFIGEKTDQSNYLLPKWNPQNPIPPEFCGIDPDCPGNCPKLSDLDPKFPRPPPLLAVDSCNDEYQSLEHLRSGSEGSFVICDFPLQWNGLVGLEAWHGCIHVLVGGTMGSTAISPGAVIFMLWHAFVDDVAYCWQCECDRDPIGGNCLDIGIPPPEPPDGCLNQLKAVVMELPKYYNLTADSFMRQVEQALELNSTGRTVDASRAEEILKILQTMQRQAENLRHKDRANGYPYHLVEEKSRRCISEISGRPQTLRGHPPQKLRGSPPNSRTSDHEERDKTTGRTP